LTKGVDSEQLNKWLIIADKKGFFDKKNDLGELKHDKKSFKADITCGYTRIVDNSITGY